MYFVYFVAVIWLMINSKTVFFPSKKDANDVMHDLETLHDAMSINAIMYCFGIISFLAFCIAICGMYYTRYYCYTDLHYPWFFDLFMTFYFVRLFYLVDDAYHVLKLIKLYGIRNNFRLYDFMAREKSTIEKRIIRYGDIFGLLFSLVLVVKLFF